MISYTLYIHADRNCVIPTGGVRASIVTVFYDAVEAIKAAEHRPTWERAQVISSDGLSLFGDSSPIILAGEVIEFYCLGVGRGEYFSR